ncbi:hypothetical protein [Neobacillus notoginsengisoli]|nr:hypothetical protein [Neobacillus notoginsengisoli]
MNNKNPKKQNREEFGMEFGDVNGIKLYELLVPRSEKDRQKEKEDTRHKK